MKHNNNILQCGFRWLELEVLMLFKSVTSFWGLAVHCLTSGWYPSFSSPYFKSSNATVNKNWYQSVSDSAFVSKESPATMHGSKAALGRQQPSRQAQSRLYNLSSWPDDFIYIAHCSQQTRYKFYIPVDGVRLMTLPSRLKPGRSYARSGWNGIVPLPRCSSAGETLKGIFYPPVQPLCIGWEVIIITRCLYPSYSVHTTRPSVAVPKLHIYC